jgi:hypothetical protein
VRVVPLVAAEAAALVLAAKEPLEQLAGRAISTSSL